MSQRMVFCFSLASILAVPAGAAGPNNPCGVHLIMGAYSEEAEQQLQWSKALIGERGYVKVFITSVDAHTRGASPEQQRLIERIYELNLIPIVRLGGHWIGAEAGWRKPEADADGGYASLARGVASLVGSLPRRDGTPLYIEVWNEPNLRIEWSGEVNLAEYGRMLVDVAAALRALDDPRIRILNGAFSLSPKAAEEMFTRVPASAHAFDVWASHPYPHNHPPEINHRDGTADPDEEHTIDAHKLELAVVERFRGERVPVIITETGYDLGNATFYDDGFPIIDDDLRADYMLRAFRDHWLHDADLLAVTPFLFCAKDWERFNWVVPGSGSDAEGLPAQRYRQYDMVRALAKPTDPTGAISGRVTDLATGVAIPGAAVACASLRTLSDPRGLFVLPALPPGTYTVSVEAEHFLPLTLEPGEVVAGRNLVADATLAPAVFGVVAGRVVDGVSGLPLEGASVEYGSPAQTVVTDPDGVFRFEQQSPVARRIVARKAGYAVHEVAGARPTLPAAGLEVPPLLLRISPMHAPAGRNLLRNPSFEAGLGETTIFGIALSWEALGAPGHYHVSDATARSGNASQCLEARGAPAAARQITHYNTAHVGGRYFAYVWAKAVGLQGGDGRLRLCATDNGGGEIACMWSGAGVSGDTGWILLEAELRCPEESERISVELHISGTSGRVYFDDAYLGVRLP